MQFLLYKDNTDINSLKYKDYIFGIYMYLRIPPFLYKFNGDKLTDKENQEQIKDFKELIKLQNEKDIKAIFVINSVFEPDTYENMQIFKQNLKTLYELGLRYLVIPSSHWILSKELINEFPEINLINSPFFKIANNQNVYDLAVNGVKYIYLDKHFLRNSDIHKKLLKLKEQFNLKFIIADDYSYIHEKNQVDNIFYYERNFIRHDFISPFYKDINNIFDIIDLRIGNEDIIEKYINKDEIVFDYNIKHIKDIEKFKQINHNCQHRCFSCQTCDRKV